METFTEQEKQWIQKIEITTHVINAVYIKLCEMESMREYAVAIKNLSLFINEEQILYQQCPFSIERLSLYMKYIEGKIDCKYSDLEAIITRNTKDRVYRRILQKLKYMSSFQKALQEDKERIRLYLVFGETPVLISKQSTHFSDFFDIEQAYKSDLYHSLLCISSSYFHQEEHASSRLLLEAKYNVSFLSFEIERSLLETDFVHPQTFFPRVDWLVYLYSVAPIQLTAMQEKYGVGVMSDQINSLLQFTDAQHQDQKIMEEILLRIACMRAAMLFMNDKQIFTMKEEFEYFVDSPQYIDVHNEDGMSVTEIQQVFKRYGEDVCYKQLIHLKLR